ncbi:MAG: hypothetical protein MI741_11745, partial [Rhodospirillales bacterium]|nr:hypothetical protein [Rhodospirillales bacterium]
PYVKHYMDEKGQHMVALATQPITKLKPQDAFELGQWYGGLSEEADEAGKPSMLLRAYDYLALASKSLPAAKRSEAEAKLAKVESSMSDLGINPPTQVASIEPVISTPAPVTPEPVTPEPVTPEPATSSSNTGLPPSTTSSLPPSTSSARPSRRKRTQVCPTCKREFMAMPGQRREICEWCDEGKKNIFEFD